METASSLLRQSQFYPLQGVVQLRIKGGSDLLAAIREGVERHGITAGVFLSGLGALNRAVFRNVVEFPEKYPVTPQNRLYYVVEKPLELISLSGWIGENEDGSPLIHAHFGASYVEGDRVVAAGGHLNEGTVASIKVVVSIGVLPAGTLRTSFDEESQSPDLELHNG